MKTHLAALIEPLRRRIAGMVARGVVALIDDDETMQALQVRLLAGETRDDVERFQQYGLTSHPHPDAEAVVVFVGGDRGHGIAVAVDDRRYRLVGLERGEVALYTDEGDKIHLKRGREIHVETTRLVISAPDGVEITGDLSVTGAVDASGEVTANAATTPVSLSTHTHSGVTPGSGNSGPPTPGT